MSESPRASIIINNYNYGRFVGKAIESALRQTYRNAQVIVVDDGSTDDSREVIHSFGSRLKSVFKENGGQGSAFNAGFAASEGEIVCFLDADDTLLPHAVESFVIEMYDDRVVKAQWPLRILDEAGNFTGLLSSKGTPPEGNLRDLVIRTGPFYDWYLTTGAAYRRHFLKSVLPMPEEPYRIGGDEYLITLAPIFGHIRNVRDSLGNYRRHGGNHYHGSSLDTARARAYLKRWEASASMLKHFLQEQTVDVDTGTWKASNFNYLWLHRLFLAQRDIVSLVDPGHVFILVDDAEWGDNFDIPDRRKVPFIERHGQYWGQPADNDTAISELERLQAQGAKYIMFWWTAAWWLEYYDGFHNYLCTRHERCLENERLIVFKLRD